MSQFRVTNDSGSDVCIHIQKLGEPFVATASGTKLPPGEWIAERIGGDTVVFSCPDHEPRILKDGKLEILKPLPKHMDF